VLWAGPLVAERDRTEVRKKKFADGEEDVGRSWRSRGATKPPTLRWRWRSKLWYLGFGGVGY
jgi:hypothetical protein